jgi:hypothetical protein
MKLIATFAAHDDDPLAFSNNSQTRNQVAKSYRYVH